MLRISLLLPLLLLQMPAASGSAKNVIIIHGDDGSDEVIEVTGGDSPATLADKKRIPPPPPTVNYSKPVSARNHINNGKFNGLDGWRRAQSSKPGQFEMWTEDNGVIWERINSRNDGGNFGVLQPLELDVSQAEKLVLEMDVRVDLHTLGGTGLWSEHRNGPGETPVHVCVSYTDTSGQGQSWHYGFLADDDENSSLKNFAVVKPHRWQHVAFDLLHDTTRRDPRGAKVLPRPAVITRIYVYGSGWDFRGGVANLWLWLE